MKEPKKRSTPARSVPRKSFNKAVERLRCQPALEFEKLAEIEGIAGRYQFPQGLDGSVLETMLVKLPAAELVLLCDTAWQELQALNPVLKKVTVNEANRIEKYYALMGVTSGFNTDDVNYFLDLHRKGVPASAYSLSQPEYSRLVNEIEQRVGYIMEWVAAPATLEKIKYALDIKDMQPRRNPSPKL